jgi:hypothetical protein
MGRYLLAGVPRSGTSWTGQALGLCDGVRYVDEPDGFRDAFAFRVMMERGENPRLAPDTAAPDYEALWAGAFAGGLRSRSVRARVSERAYHEAGTEARRAARRGDRVRFSLRVAQALAVPPVGDPEARHVFVKSVQCARSISWIATHFDPTVVVLLRNPLNTIASWRDLDFVRNPREFDELVRDAGDRWRIAPPVADDALTVQSYMFGVLTTALLEAADAHPEWTIARHEELCLDARSELRNLAQRLGLVWTEAAEQFVAESDRRGEGYVTARVSAEQPDRWRERLSAADVDCIRRVLDGFPERVRVVV